MKPEIMEVTLRDGSYEVGYQFTLEDVFVIGGLLDRAGFKYIEVGHGSGIGAGNIPIFEDKDVAAAASDEQYMRTARRAIKDAKVGVPFFSNTAPNYESLVHLVHECEMDFLRVILHPNELALERNAKVVRLAKALGLTVSVNFLKSHCFTPAVVGDAALTAEDLGADWVYVVDSAGSFSDHDVGVYIGAVRERCGLRVGYHAHNNVAGAISGTMAAMKAGATLLDCSLQGMGRATGNAPTEVLLGLLQARHGLEQHVDRRLVYSLARRYLRPYMNPGLNPTHVLSGLGGVHSSRLPRVADAARRRGLVLDDVLVELGEEAHRRGCLFSLSKQEVEALCDHAKSKLAPPSAYELESLVEQLVDVTQPPRGLDELFAELKVRRHRDHLSTVLAVVSPQCWPLATASLDRRAGCAVGVLAADRFDAAALAQVPWVERLLVDERVECALSAARPDLRAERFRLTDLLAEAATADVGQVVLVACADRELQASVAARLWRSTLMSQVRELGGSSATIVLQGAGSHEAPLAQVLERLGPGMTLVLAGAHEVLPETLATFAERGARVEHVDPWPGLIARAVRVAWRAAREAAPADGVVVTPRGLVLHPAACGTLGWLRGCEAAAPAATDRVVLGELHRRRLMEIVGVPEDET